MQHTRIVQDKDVYKFEFDVSVYFLYKSHISTEHCTTQ